jgi:hypothetical protein
LYLYEYPTSDDVMDLHFEILVPFKLWEFWGTETTDKGRTTEIGLEHAPFFVYFFYSFEHAKNLLIKGPNKTKNSQLKCDFLIFNYE